MGDAVMRAPSQFQFWLVVLVLCVTARRTVPLQQRLMDSKDTLAFRIGGGCRPPPFRPGPTPAAL
ncbi:hypothetical protein BN1263180038 [Stenotrophomonas indicatrix]|nr:hypothetical protein BN1263180038 [Stenotrophomonas indicatrix]